MRRKHLDDFHKETAKTQRRFFAVWLGLVLFALAAWALVLFALFQIVTSPELLGGFFGKIANGFEAVTR